MIRSHHNPLAAGVLYAGGRSVLSMMTRRRPFRWGIPLLALSLSGCLFLTEPDPFVVSPEPPSATIPARRTTVTLVGFHLTDYR